MQAVAIILSRNGDDLQ